MRCILSWSTLYSNMKKILTLLLVICFTNALSAGDLWPQNKYAHVVAYCYDYRQDKENSLIVDDTGTHHKGIISSLSTKLSAEQTSKLRKLLVTAPQEDQGEADCYMPHHAFVFYDKDWSVKAHISICFGCGNFRAFPENIPAKLDLVKLREFTKSLSLPVYRKPKSYTALFYRLEGKRNAKKPAKPASFEEALEAVNIPQSGFGNMSLFELQVYYRLAEASYRLGYTDATADLEEWLKVVKDPKRNMYARICAAHFIANLSVDARKFLEEQLDSTNLRHRYNAAEAVYELRGEFPAQPWGRDILIKHIESGALDGSGVKSSPEGDYPNGDRDDIMITPLESICRSLGRAKCQTATPAIMALVRRNPYSRGAIDALGEIGDRKAISLLMELLQKDTGYQSNVISALTKLNAVEAIPILNKRLRRAATSTNGGFHFQIEVERILEALLVFKDPSSIQALKEFIAANGQKSLVATAKRILIQLDSKDPVASLKALLNQETYEPERSDIVFALARYPEDKRVVETLSLLAGESDSAFMRREAISALGEVDSRQALLALAELIDKPFPNNLKAKWGWKVAPKDFTEFFQNQILWILKEKTGEDFPKVSDPWKKVLSTYQPIDGVE